MSLKVAAAGIGFINGILIARSLGPDQYGVYSIVLAAVSLLGTLATLGLPALLTRDVAVHHSRAEWDQLKGRMASSHRWVFFSSLCLMILGATLGKRYFHKGNVTEVGWITGLALIPLTGYNLLRAAVLRGLHWVVSADIPDLLVRPLTVLILITSAYAIGFRLDSNHALFIQAIAATVTLMVGFRFLTHHMPGEVALAKAETTQFHWMKSTGVFLAITVVGILESQLPLYLLGYLATPGQAGLYQAANQLVGIVVMGITAVNLPLQPRLAKAWVEKDITTAQRLVTEAAHLGTAFALLAACVLVPFADAILSLYGPMYVAAAWPLRVLILGQVINAVSGSCGVVLAMTGYQRLALMGTGTALIGNFAASCLLIPRMGIVGAAIAAVIGLIIWNGALVYWAWKKTHLLTVFQYEINKINKNVMV
ncbi:MAG: oligosaccharide flippase family protein [Thermodesulfobacteriota bacterium]